MGFGPRRVLHDAVVSEKDTPQNSIFTHPRVRMYYPDAHEPIIRRNEVDTVKSTSDERTVNNTMRQNYRILSAKEKDLVDRIKGTGTDFLGQLHEAGDTGFGERMSSRELSLAQTKIEEAVMWAVKHVTK